MRGTSAASLETAAAAFEPVLRAAGADAATLGDQLFSVVDALDGSGSLRRALSDPSRSGDDKARLVSDLLSAQVDDRAVEVLSALVRGRWSAEADLTEAVEEVAIDAMLASAQSSGDLERVEDELFRLDRLLVGERDVRRGLVDRRVPAEARATLVEDLLEGKVHEVTERLARRAAVAPRGRSFSATLALVGRLAARRRQQLVASVTAAVVPSKAQTERLGALLERAYGRPVHLNVSVDPEVIGGLRVQVGSEVVDSTVLGHLDEVRRRVAG